VQRKRQPTKCCRAPCKLVCAGSNVSLEVWEPCKTLISEQVSPTPTHDASDFDSAVGEFVANITPGVLLPDGSEKRLSLSRSRKADHSRASKLRVAKRARKKFDQGAAWITQTVSRSSSNRIRSLVLAGDSTAFQIQRGRCGYGAGRVGREVGLPASPRSTLRICLARFGSMGTLLHFAKPQACV
jgi:hypothetical protein